jgi:hypothetical protein
MPFVLLSLERVPFIVGGSPATDFLYKRGLIICVLLRAVTHAVSRMLPTAAAQVRVRVWSSGICGGQSGAGQVFSEYFGFS